MSTKLEQLQEIAARFMGFGKAKPEPVKQPEKFETAKIKDGDTMIDYDPTLEVGSPVNISGGDGSNPSPDGTVTLANGISFVVKDGKIESVINGNPDEGDDTKAAAEDMSAYVPKEDFDNLKKEFEEFKEAQLKVAEGFAQAPTKAEIEAFTANLKIVGEFINELATITVKAPEAQQADVETIKQEAFTRVAQAFMK